MRLPSIAAVLAAALLAASAHAGPELPGEALARDEFERGKAALAEERWADGCALLESSLRRFHSLGAELKVARCHEHEGRLVEAVRTYEDVLRRNDATDDDERRGKIRAWSDAQLATLRPRLAWLRVSVASRADEVDLKCDGARLDAIDQGMLRAVDPGVHRVDASAPEGGLLVDGGDPDAGDELPPGIATLHGKVVAPEGTIPISGALVYLIKGAPPAIPSGNYCDECVQLGDTTPYAFSRADGTFDLPAYSEGSWQLVVQKGQFRRVRAIDVVAGDVAVPLASTTLPSKTDAANGDTIPKMAIVNMVWDHIDVTLGRLGLGTIVNNGIFGQGVDRTTAPYDFWDSTFNAGSKGDYQTFLSNPALMAQYNIIFLPCAWSESTTCDTTQPAGDPQIQANLQQFVQNGGKLYVTDYAYEFVRQPFPGFVTWQDESSALGSACLPGAWDSPAVSPDQGLTDWLAAQGIASFDIQQSWTAIETVHAQPGVDVNGNPVTITPKVWVQTPSQAPATISFEQKCGRVLFSTYHTEASDTLAPQERALLYVLLEVAVCVAPPSVH